MSGKVNHELCMGFQLWLYCLFVFSVQGVLCQGWVGLVPCQVPLSHRQQVPWEPCRHPPPSTRVLAHLTAQLPSKVRTGADTVQEAGLMWMVLKSGNHSGPFWGPRNWKGLQELSNLLSSESLKPHPSLHLPTAGTLTTTPDTQLHGDSWNCGRALPFLMSY